MAGIGDSAISVHVSDGCRIWIPVIIARMVRTRAGPLRVMWRIEVWVKHIGGSD